MQQRNGLSHRLQMLFWAVFTAAFGWLTFQVVFAQPFYPHYHWFTVLPAAAVWAGLLGGLWWLLHRCSQLLLRRTGLCLAVFFALLTLLQLLFYRQFACYPSRDFVTVFYGAYNYTIAGIIENPYLEYFYYYPNNLPLTIVLQFLFRAFYRLGVTDFFTLGTVFNAACVDLAYLFLFLIVRKLKDTASAFFALGVLALCAPIQSYISYFYTDTTTMLFPLAAVYWGLCLMESAGLKQQLRYAALLGLFVGFGTELKYSVILSFLALCVTLALNGCRRQLALAALCVALCFGAFRFGFNRFAYTHILDEDTAYDKATPMLAWIAMGMGGDGSHNAEDNYAVWAQETHAEKVAIAKQQLADRLTEKGIGGTLLFLNRKAVRSFGSGDMEYVLSLSYSPMRQTLGTKILEGHGTPYLVYDTFVQGYHVLLLCCLVLGGALALRRRDATLFLPQVAAFGLLLFLLLWEAGTRYLLNYYPILLLCALPGYQAIFGWWARRHGG